MTKRIAVALTLLATVWTPAFAGGPVVDATTYTVQCNTVIGSIKFSPALVNQGTATSETGKVKATLAGCAVVTPSDSGLTIESGAVSGKLTSSSNDCATLVSGGPASGTLKIKWKTTPKLLDSTSIETVSALTFSFFVPPSPFTGTYGAFHITASGITGPFQGSDGGATSFGDGSSGQDVTALLGACASTKGLSLVNFGVGDIMLQ